MREEYLNITPIDMDKKGDETDLNPYLDQLREEDKE
jgi:hypothetical protein